MHRLYATLQSVCTYTYLIIISVANKNGIKYITNMVTILLLIAKMVTIVPKHMMKS